MRRRTLWLLFLLPLGISCGGMKKQVQDSVRQLDHALLKREDVEVVEIRESGSQAVAEVKIRTALRLEKVGGKWEVREVRLGDRRWEKIEHLEEILNRQRARTTAEQLNRIQEGIEKYRSERGEVPPGEDFRALIDTLVPAYLPEVIRIDAWFQPFLYRSLSAQQYELRSVGPDGRPYSQDDLVRRSAP